MELRHIYQIATAINNSAKQQGWENDAFKDIEITVNVSPTTHYGIDKEFYRITHNDSDEGFVHNEETIVAKIDNINFVIKNKNAE